MSVQALVAVMNATELEVDATQMAVLIQLANCAAEDGTNAWPSVATLAARARISERAVHGALRKLEAGRVIRATRLSSGRRPTVYAINMRLLEASVSAHVRPMGEGAPDFDAPDPRGLDGSAAGGPTLHDVQGCEAPTLQQVQPTLQQVQPTLHHVQGNPAGGADKPVKNLFKNRERPGARDPDGRAPGPRRVAERAAPRPAPVRRMGDGPAFLQDEARAKLDFAGMDEPGRRRAFEIWTSLVVALLARREADAVRTWVLGPGVASISTAARVFVVARGAVGRRAREALEPILQRHGWRVVEAGTAWADGASAA